jgi:class 3 adenylate cyclase
MDVAGQERLSPSPPERRYLTIMFIDMVGYTELSEQLEPEDLLALLNRYQQLALTVMERFGGFVASFSGGGVLVYFGYPTAHGNDAERALRAALEMIERLSAMDLPLSDGGTRRLGRQGSACIRAW